jgi:hypothetical protein
MTTDPDNQPATSDPIHASPSTAVLEQIRDLLRGLRFGTLTIIVQDGVVVQIERTEKRRLRGPCRGEPAK